MYYKKDTSIPFNDLNKQKIASIREDLKSGKASNEIIETICSLSWDDIPMAYRFICSLFAVLGDKFSFDEKNIFNLMKSSKMATMSIEKHFKSNNVNKNEKSEMILNIVELSFEIGELFNSKNKEHTN